MDPAAQGTILADALLIDRVVKRFEEAWRNGEQPQVEPFLEGLPATHRSIAHQRLHAAAHRLQVEEDKRELENDSLAVTYLHDTSELDTKNGETPPATPANMPERLGAFELQAELGRGAFGVVYQAYDSRLDRKVAIKVPLLDSEKSRQQYIDEARKAAMIESVGIVPVYHVDTTANGSPYVVQKFIDGPNLRSLLQRVGGLGLQPALTIVRDVARSLALAHRSGMIHRDLKPENILLDKEGVPWIADFGLALREDEQDGREGEVAGTPLYMSPEQVRGNADWLDGRTDIWAAGVLLYELIAGRPPFNAKNVERLIREICRRDPKPLSQRSADIPVELDEIFSRCCAKKARDRFASADELATRLDQVLQELFPGGSTLSDTSAWPSTAHSTQPSAGSEAELPARLSGGERAARTASPRQTKRNSAVEVLSEQDSGEVQPTVLLPARRPMRWGLWGAAILLAVAALGSGAYIWSSSPSRLAGKAAGVPGDNPRQSEPPGIVEPPSPPEPPWPYEPAALPPDVPFVIPPPDFSHLVVSLDGQKPVGQEKAYQTISEALADVESGGEVELRPGFYNESLVIDKPVVLSGANSRSQVVIQSTAGPCVTVKGGTLAAGRITFRGQGVPGQHEFNTIDLVEGAVQLTDCEVSAATFCCVKARKGTRLTAAECGFVALTDSAVSCRESQPVSLSGCTFRDCSEGAAIELISGTGSIIDCKVLGNNQYGIYCEATGETPVSVRNCTLEGCQRAGIQSLEQGAIDIQGGMLTRCKVSVEARGGSVRMRDLVALDGTGPCLSVTRQGRVEATGCEFRACLVGLAMEDSQVKLTDCQILAMGYMGVFTKPGSHLELIDCRIERARETGMTLVDTRLTITGGSVSHNGAGGIYASGSRGVVTANNVTIDANSKIGFHLTDGAASFTGGQISKHEFGVLVESSPGAIEATDFDARLLLLDSNTEAAFQFLDGTEGDLKACRTLGHPPNKDLLESPKASVLVDKECKFGQ
ncbi:protein kinase domain-containing protein [Roseimaritima ulvae]|uniref:Serine/threonine-protein kinase PknB n=1 Tax=Roseimaritima ulvae TaxID=980254 RepID=A0A5B9QWK5_9BACT|nr:protein kinase [Roseimaritima ulvae]QEG38351.1 Serine/threonine-protein kinase PknB [Roseimaritima ulvae]